MQMETRSSDTWKQRFRAPIVALTGYAAQAPDRGLAVSNRSGAYQLYAWDVPGGELRQLTQDPDGLMTGALSPDGRFVYYVEDKGGNEIGHWVRVPFEGGEPQDITPDLPPYSSWAIDFSRAGNLMGFMAADDSGFHLYVLDLGREDVTAARRLVYESEKLIFGPLLSYGGEIGVVATTERTGKPSFSLIAVDVSDGHHIAELYDGPDSSTRPHSFAPMSGDFRVLAVTDRSGVDRPLIWNPRTGERTDLELTELEGDVVPFDWSPDGKRLLLCQFTQAVQHLWVYDLESKMVRKLEQAPSGTYGFYSSAGVYFRPDGEIYAQWQDSTHPTQLVALDPETGQRTRTVLPAGEVPPSHPWRSITVSSPADDSRVQAWLAVPQGQSGPLPTILETHGGPEAVTTEVFLPRAQVWLDRGFAYVTVNYHGSTTFGRAFQESIWGHPGELEVEDMAAVRQYLVQQGIARPDQVFVTGWSYGGYLTLQALGTKPALWAGGMAGVAVADWRMDYEDAAETLKGYDVAFFGGSPEEKPEAYAKASPITYVDNVRAPVLIIQGRNDTRCPPRQVEVYQQKMQELGKPCEVHWFEAGHMVGQVEEAIEFTEIMLEFAGRVLQQTAQPAT